MNSNRLVIMKSIIIGIHGLRNKPPKYVLTHWWETAIREGFERHGLPAGDFDFSMAYWAHCIHEKSQNPDITDPHHPQYLPEPYEPQEPAPVRRPKSLRKRISGGINQEILQLFAGESGLINRDRIRNAILHRMFAELDIYWHHELKNEDGAPVPARGIIRAQLADMLKKHRGERICLLAHSMGSIIAYDVMTHDVPDIPVHTFITFGSPLGFPVIRNRIRGELETDGAPDTPLPVPPAVTRCWINYADPDDVTCLNFNLTRLFSHNAHGVRPSDRMIVNYYSHNGVPNPHKAYGYLRSGDMARELYRFLRLEDAGFFRRLGWLFRPPAL